MHGLENDLERVVRILARDAGLRVVFRGFQANVELEKKVMVLPATKELPNWEKVRGYLDHEVGHVLYTEAAPFKALIKSCRPTVEMLFRVVEDARIERLVQRRYPGSRINLAEAHEYALERRDTTGWDDKQRFWMGLADLIIIGRETDCEMANDAYQSAKDLFDLLHDQETTAQCIQLCEKIVERWKMTDVEPPKSEKPKSEKPKSDGESSGAGSSSDDDEGEGASGSGDGDDENESEESDESGDGGDEGDEGDDEGDDEGAGAGDEGDDEGDDESGEGDESEGSGNSAKGADGSDEGDEDGESDTDGASDGSPLAVSDDGDGDAAESEAPGTSGDGDDGEPSMLDKIEELGAPDPDMLDELKRSFTEDAEGAVSEESYLPFTTEFDVVEDTSGERSDAAERRVADQAAQITGILRNKLEAYFTAEVKSRWISERDRGTVDRRTLARLPMGTSSKVFKTFTEGEKKDTAVLLLVDCSGSMRGRKIEMARVLAYAFADLLERIGVPCEIAGFGSCQSRSVISAASGDPDCRRFSRIYERLEYQVVKPFHKVLKRSAVSNLEPIPQNTDGESVMVAAQRLSMRPESRKILFVLSDGYPENADNASMHSLREHLKDTVAQIEKAGIQTIGLGMQSQSVADFYPDHVVFRSLDSIASGVLKKLQEVLSR